MTDEREVNRRQPSYSIEEEVQKAVSGQLKIYKVAVIAFIAGFALLLSFNLVTEGEIFKTVIKGIYPPQEIYKDIVEVFEDDESFKLDKYPHLEKEIPKQVWDTVSEGSEDDYEKMVSQDAFYNALIKHHTGVVETILLPTSSREKRAREIMKNLKDIPLDVQLMMAGEEAHNTPTARCHKTFKNNKLHAEMVIPESAEPQVYAWFECTIGWPTITLKVNEVDGVKLVGVRRNGKSKHLSLLLSRKAAQDLELPGWEDYTSYTFGRMMITDAQ